MNSEKQVNLLYRLNLNTYVMSDEQRHRYADELLPEMVQALRVPTSFSISGEDLMYLRHYYPDTFDVLTTHELVSFYPCLFSSAVATHSEVNDYLVQVRLGSMVTRDLIKPERLASIGYPSELDIVESPGLLSKIMKYWQGLLLIESRVDFSSKGGDMFRMDNDLPVMVLRKSSANYRDATHAFYEERCEAGAVVAALEHDVKEIKAPIYVAKMDGETLVVNVITKDGRDITGPRIDLWRELQEELDRSQLRFVDAMEVEWIMLAADSTGTVMHNAESDWYLINDQLTKILVSLRDLASDNDTMYLLWLSCWVSDYFAPDGYVPQDWDQREKVVERGVIMMPQGPVYRLPELRAKIAYIQNTLAESDIEQSVLDYLYRVIKVAEGVVVRHNNVQVDEPK